MNAKQIEELFRHLHRGYDEAGYGIVKVDEAGKAKQMKFDALIAQVILFGLKENTGYVYVGFDDEVSSSHYGHALAKEGNVVIPINNMSKIWLDADISDEGVSYICLI